jgi:uncharacterized protein
VIFWDASAIIPLILSEPTTGSVRATFGQDAGMTVWWGTPVECESALARNERLRTVSFRAVERARRRLHALQAAWDEIHPSDSIRELARTLLRRYPLRAADALQLAAAVAWAEGRPPRNAVMTLDKRLAEAARTEGFELVLPFEGET